MSRPWIVSLVSGLLAASAATCAGETADPDAPRSVAVMCGPLQAPGYEAHGGMDPWVWAFRHYLVPRLNALSGMKLLNEGGTRNTVEKVRSGIRIFEERLTFLDRFTQILPCDAVLFVTPDEIKGTAREASRLTATLFTATGEQSQHWQPEWNDPLRLVLEMGTWVCGALRVTMTPEEANAYHSRPTRNPQAVASLIHGMSSMTYSNWDDPLTYRMAHLTKTLEVRDFAEGHYYYLQQAARWGARESSYPSMVFSIGPSLLKAPRPWCERALEYLAKTEDPVLFKTIRVWLSDTVLMDELEPDEEEDEGDELGVATREVSETISSTAQQAACRYMGMFARKLDREDPARKSMVVLLKGVTEADGNAPLCWAVLAALADAGEKLPQTVPQGLSFSDASGFSVEGLRAAAAKPGGLPEWLVRALRDRLRPAGAVSTVAGTGPEEEAWTLPTEVTFGTPAYWAAVARSGDDYAARYALRQMSSWPENPAVRETVNWALGQDTNLFLTMAALEHRCRFQPDLARAQLRARLGSQWLPLRLWAAQMFWRYPDTCDPSVLKDARAKASHPAVQALLSAAIDGNTALARNPPRDDRVPVWSFGLSPVRGDMPLNAQELDFADFEKTPGHASKLAEAGWELGVRLRWDLTHDLVYYATRPEARLRLYGERNRLFALPDAKRIRMFNLGDEDLFADITWPRLARTFALCVGLPLPAVATDIKQQPLAVQKVWRRWSEELTTDGHAWVKRRSIGNTAKRWP